ncbi:MAG: type II toxin-antitoxin system RelE/ParE family toxin [Nitrosospira sp.]
MAAFALWSPPTKETVGFFVRLPKNERSNIAKDEEDALKKLAAHLLSLTTPMLVQAQRAPELIEVDCNAEN